MLQNEFTGEPQCQRGLIENSLPCVMGCVFVGTTTILNGNFFVAVHIRHIAVRATWLTFQATVHKGHSCRPPASNTERAMSKSLSWRRFAGDRHMCEGNTRSSQLYQCQNHTGRTDAQLRVPTFTNPRGSTNVTTATAYFCLKDRIRENEEQRHPKSYHNKPSKSRWSDEVV